MVRELAVPAWYCLSSYDIVFCSNRVPLDHAQEEHIRPESDGFSWSPKALYRRPRHAGPRSKAGASWSGSAGKACNAQSAICAFRAGRATGRELPFRLLLHLHSVLPHLAHCLPVECAELPLHFLLGLSLLVDDATVKLRDERLEKGHLVVVVLLAGRRRASQTGSCWRGREC